MNGDWLYGRDPEKYSADPNASNIGGAGGASGGVANQTLRNIGTEMQGAQGRESQRVQGASAGEGQKLDTGRYDQTRAGQQGLIGSLIDVGNGQGPSGAGLAAGAQRSAALSNAAALQAGRRGQGAASGARMGTLAAQMGNQQASQNEAIGRANEMSTARGQAAGMFGQLAGQDISVAGQNAAAANQKDMFNAGQFQQAHLANQNAALQQQGLNDQYTLGLGGQALNSAQAEMNARMQQEQMKYGNLDPGSNGALGAAVDIGTKFGTAALISDRSAKTNLTALSDLNDDRSTSGGRAQLMGIGQRIVPVGRTAWDRAQNSVEHAADAVTGAMLIHAMEKAGSKKDKAKTDAAALEKKTLDPDQYKRDPDTGLLGSQQPLITSPSQIPQAPIVDPNAVPTVPQVPGAPIVVTSDERSKREKQRAHDMEDELTAYSYRYKPDALESGIGRPGLNLGVMAQDLEKSDAGREMVGKDPQTGYKAVDYGRGLSTMMAGIADLNDRLSKIEDRKRKA